jgi:hypothetical protein
MLRREIIRTGVSFVLYLFFQELDIWKAEWTGRAWVRLWVSR